MHQNIRYNNGMVFEDFEEVGTWEDTPLLDCEENLAVIQDEDEEDAVDTEYLDKSPSLKGFDHRPDKEAQSPMRRVKKKLQSSEVVSIESIGQIKE